MSQFAVAPLSERRKRLGIQEVRSETAATGSILCAKGSLVSNKISWRIIPEAMPPRVSPSTLLIRHLPGSHPAAFQVTRLSDGKTAEPASPPSPLGFPVEGRPSSDLMRELRWYLETFLDYPFPPETGHAERVLQSLKHWGEQTFDALFASRAAGRMFDAATAEDYSQLHLQISSNQHPSSCGTLMVNPLSPAERHSTVDGRIIRPVRR